MGKDLEDFLRSAMAPSDEAPASVYPLFLFGDLQQGGRGEPSKKLLETCYQLGSSRAGEPCGAVYQEQ